MKTTDELELKFNKDLKNALEIDGESCSYNKLKSKYKDGYEYAEDWYGKGIYTEIDGMTEAEIDELWKSNKQEAYKDYMDEHYSLDAIQQQESGSIVETTSERNGYPRNLQDALIFDDDIDFDEYERVAEKYGLTIIELHKQDGWNLWTRGNKMYEPYDVRNFWLNKEYEMYNDEDNVLSVFKDRISYAQNLENIKNLVDDAIEIKEELDNVGDDEFVAYDPDNRRVEVFPNTSCSLYYDTHSYQLALIRL